MKEGEHTSVSVDHLDTLELAQHYLSIVTLSTDSNMGLNIGWLSKYLQSFLVCFVSCADFFVSPATLFAVKDIM